MKRQGNWELLGQEDLDFLETKKDFWRGNCYQQTRAFLNNLTGEVRFFTSQSVEYLGAVNIIKKLNKGEL